MKNILNPQDKAEILARLNCLSPDSRALWGTMNAGQAICHLNDELRHILGQRSSENKPSFFLKHVIKNLILLGMSIPKGKAKAHPNLAQEYKGTAPTNLENDRRSLIANMDALISKSADSKWHPNPLFGAMNKQQHGRMTYAHMNHHLQQFGV